MFLGGKGRDLSFLAVAVESGVWLIHIDYVGEMVLTNSTWVLWDISGHNVAEGKVQLP